MTHLSARTDHWDASGIHALIALKLITFARDVFLLHKLTFGIF